MAAVHLLAGREHEAVDPLGKEHSWRRGEAFVRSEVEAVRAADPGRPVMMNGFLSTSTPVALQQWWRTRDQGDSLAVARRLADIVGIDFYPRTAPASAGLIPELVPRIKAHLLAVAPVIPECAWSAWCSSAGPVRDGQPANTPYALHAASNEHITECVAAEKKLPVPLMDGHGTRPP